MTTETKAKINHLQKTITVDVYEWNCPECGKLRESEYDPGEDSDRLHCNPCQDIVYERDKQAWIERVKERCAYLVGATLTGVTPDAEYWLDTSVEYADISTIDIEQGGKRYQIYADETGHLMIRELKAPQAA